MADLKWSPAYSIGSANPAGVTRAGTVLYIYTWSKPYNSFEQHLYHYPTYDSILTSTEDFKCVASDSEVTIPYIMYYSTFKPFNGAPT